MKKTNSILASSMLAAAMAFSSCAPTNTGADDVTESINPTEVTALASPETNNTESADLPDSTECVEASDEKVLLIDNGTLGESEFDYSYDIQKIIIQTIDKNKEGKEKTIEFAGKQYKLRYDKTVEYYLLNTTVDEYRIIKEDAEQEERCCVRLLPDDTIYTIADHPILSIDIKEGESGEKVKAKVENALKDEIDFDEYEYCRIDEPDDSAGFYYYCFVWRNVKGNIVRGDTVSVAVKYDGDITVIWMKNKVDNGYDTLPDDLSLDDYLPQIESKLKKIYGDAFVDYEVKSSFVGNIDGNLCIICDVDADYNDKQNEKTYDQIELAVFINQ